MSKKQLLFSLLVIPACASLALDRLDSASYGGAALWILITLIHAGVVLEWLMQYRKARYPS